MFRAFSGAAGSNRGTYNLQQKEKHRNKECFLVKPSTVVSSSVQPLAILLPGFLHNLFMR